MNESTTMYTLKPIITRNEELKLDSCMYEMKNIHGARNDHACQEKGIVADIAKKVTNFLKDPSEFMALAGRQEKILQQLAAFQETLLQLSLVFKGKSLGKENDVREQVNSTCEEVIVKANPSKPCYAVQALAKIWKDVEFDVNVYKHSSILDDVPEFRIERKKTFSSCVKLSLIWKRVEDLEVVISGVHAYPLIGETNLLRYLIRVFPCQLSVKASTPEALTSLDYILDLSHRLTYQESPKELQSTLSQFGENLGNNNWLMNESKAGVADVAAWSAIKRASLAKLPSNLSAWFDRCEKSFL